MNASNKYGKAPHYALEKGHTKMAVALIDEGADVNARDKNGYTPLHH